MRNAPTDDRFHFAGEAIAPGQLTTLHGFSNQWPLSIGYRIAQKRTITRLAFGIISSKGLEFRTSFRTHDETDLRLPAENNARPGGSSASPLCFSGSVTNTRT
jgi:hypothetical protein